VSVTVLGEWVRKQGAEGPVDSMAVEGVRRGLAEHRYRLGDARPLTHLVVSMTDQPTDLVHCLVQRAWYRWYNS
jgi:hypothetical protein